MKKLACLLALAVFLGMSPAELHAQFEGKIIYNSYKVDSGGAKKQNDRFEMYITPDRILLQGKNEYGFMGSIKTEGVLVRLDYEDFVFLTGDNKALKISKSDITSMMNMFGDEGTKSGGRSSEGDTPGISYEKTGETRTLNGYSCEKFIFRDRDDEDDYAAVWMTKDLAVNWGMLAEPWGSSTSMMTGGDFPMGMIFNDGYFPVRIESYDGGQLESVTEAEEITESGVAKAMVQVPSGVTVLSFQDYLFQKMQEQ